MVQNGREDSTGKQGFSVAARVSIPEHKPTELLLWTGLCRTWTTFLVILLSTSRGQKGSRQIETLLYVSHVLCLCSKIQEENQGVSW